MGHEEHEILNEEDSSTLDGHWHVLVCSCGEPFESGPDPSAAAARNNALKMRAEASKVSNRPPEPKPDPVKEDRRR